MFWAVCLAPEKRFVRYVRYHALHGLSLGITLWFTNVVLQTLMAMVAKQFPFLESLGPAVSWLFGLGSALVTIGSTFYAWKGRWLRLPFLTDLVVPFLDDPPLNRGLNTDVEPL
jgi:uncharacterized membrane protein